MRILIQILLGFVITAMFVAPINNGYISEAEGASKNFEFGESTSQTQTHTVTLPNYQKLINIKANTGTAKALSNNGDEVTIQVSGGSSSRREQTGGSPADSKFVTNQTSSYYNSSGYSGTLDRYLHSGSYTPADSKVVSDSKSKTFSEVCEYTGESWDLVGAPMAPQVNSWASGYLGGISYNKDGYTGHLSYGSPSYSITSLPSNPSVGQRATRYCYATVNFSGTVTRPESDTRVYRYEGTVSKPDTRTWQNYYQYSITVNYVDNQLPKLELSSPSNNLPLSEVEGFNKATISGSIIDQDVGDILKIYYKVDSGTEIQLGNDIAATGNEQNFDFEVDLSSVPEGKHKLYVWVEDDKGGKSEKIINFTMDKSPPVTDAPTIEVLSSSGIRVTPTATDPSGLFDTPYLYNQDGEDITDWVADNPLTISGLIPNTQYTFKYKARDAVGNISDYSTEISQFTLALDPEGLEVVSKDSASIVFNINETPGNGVPPEYKVEVKLKGAGAIGGVVAVSDFSSVTTGRTITGLEADTEYEVWLTTRNGDDIENPSILLIDGIISNYSPNIAVTNNKQNVSAVDGFNIITITGKVHDRDGDDVTISATIDGVTKTTTVSPTPTEVPTEDNWTLVWDVAADDINEGDYADIVITAEDDRNGSNTATFTGTIKVDLTVPIPKDPVIISCTDTAIAIHAEANDDDDGVGLHEAPYLYNRDGENIGDWQIGDYTDSELVPNTQYTYKYKARDAVGNESDSTEVSKYTLALDPTGLKVTDKDASTITFKIINDEANGNPPEHRIEVKLVGAGIDGEIVSDSDFSIATTDRIVTGLTPGTEYEVWVTTRNGDLEANEPVKLIANISTNYPPVLVVSNVDENQHKSAITPHNVVKITGKIYDLDKDQVTIKVTMGGVEKSVLIDSAPENEPDENNWELTWDGSELAEGTYSGFDIVATDVVNNEVKQSYTGTITIDHTAPGITPGYPVIDNADVAPDSIKVKMDATDNYTDATKINYILEHYANGAWEVVTQGENLTEATHSDLMGNNLYKYRFKVQDAVGNESNYSPEINKFTKAHNPTGILVLEKTDDSFTLKLIENPNNTNPPLYKVEVIEPDTGTVVGSNGGFLGGSEPITIGGFATDKEYEVRITAANAELVTNTPTTYTLIAPELEIGNDDVGPGDEKSTVIIDLPELPEGAVRYEYKVQDTPFIPRPMVGLVFNGTHLETPYKIPVAPGQYVGIAAVDADGRIIRFKEFNFTDPELIDKLPKFDSISVEIDSTAVSEINIPEGLTKQLVVKAVYTGGHKEDITSSAVYEITDTSIATVSSAGLVNALSTGSISITVTTTIDDITKEVTLPIEVTAAVPTKLTVAADKYSIEIGQKAQASATLSYSNGTTQDVTSSASWTVSDTNKATVIAGEVTGKGSGDVTVTAQFGGLSDRLNINIKNPPPVLVNISVEPNSICLKVGETEQLKTTAYFSDGGIQDVTNLAKYLSEDSSVISIDSNGAATCVAVGQTTILVEVSGKQVSIPVKVEPIAPKVTGIFATKSMKLMVGETKGIKVVAYLSDDTIKDVTNLASFTSQNSSIASVVRGGTIKGIAEGVTSIYIDYADHYVSVSVVVTKPDNEPGEENNGNQDKPSKGGKGNSSKGSNEDETGSVVAEPELPETEPPFVAPITPEPDVEIPIEPWQPVENLQPELEQPSTNSPTDNSNALNEDNIYSRGTTHDNLMDNINKNQSVSAQKYGTVFGSITDASGMPLANIKVELHSTPRVTYSDKNGLYRFENVELGNHTIFINDDKLLSSTQIDLTVKQGVNEVLLPNTSKALLALSDDSLSKEVNFIVVPKEANSPAVQVNNDLKDESDAILTPTIAKVAVATAATGAATISLIYWPRRRKNVIIKSDNRTINKLTVQPKQTLIINITNQLSNFDTIQIIFKSNLLKKMKDKTIVLRFGAKDIAYFVVTDQTTELSAKVIADTLDVEWHPKENNKK